MLKDIVVNLPLNTSRDAVTDFALSFAAGFDAYLTGIAFLYVPFIPIMVDAYGYGIPSDVIKAQRAENEEAARAAVDRFDEVARRFTLSAEARVVDAPVAGAPNAFAKIARRFDLSVIAQAQPDRPAHDRLLVEAALFDSGRPVLIVPYIQGAGLKLDHVLVGWDGSRSEFLGVTALVSSNQTYSLNCSGKTA
jgi:hypothetical protein